MNPITAKVILTRRCNLNCKYCAIPDRRATELPAKDWLRAIDIIADFGIRKINFIGGEATLYKDVREVVSHALKKIEYCSLITNGIKGYPVVKDLLSLGLKNVSFSLDTADVENSISPIKAKAGLELIKALDKDNLLKDNNLTAYCVINKTNIGTIPALVEYLSDKNVGTYFLPFNVQSLISSLRSLFCLFGVALCIISDKLPAISSKFSTVDLISLVISLYLAIDSFICIFSSAIASI